MILYLSYSSGRQTNPDWWIVEPRDNPWPQVESLLRANRRVVKIEINERGVNAYELNQEDV